MIFVNPELVKSSFRRKDYSFGFRTVTANLATATAQAPYTYLSAFGLQEGPLPFCGGARRVSHFCRREEWRNSSVGCGVDRAQRSYSCDGRPIRLSRVLY